MRRVPAWTGLLAAAAIGTGCATTASPAVEPSKPVLPPKPGQARPGLPPAPADRVTSAIAATGATVTAGKRGGLDLVLAEPPSFSPRRPADIVVFFHGAGSDQWDAMNSLGTPVVAEFLRRGYVVVADNLAGTSYGNPPSMRRAAELGRWITSRYRVRSTLTYSMSMGAMTSLDVAMRGNLPKLRAWIGTSPICNLGAAWSSPYFAEGARSAWVNQPEAEIADGDPMRTSRIAALDGLAMLFVYSPADAMVPDWQHARACGERAAVAGAKVSYLRTSGAHGEPGNYPAQPIAEFADRVVSVPSAH